jgi:hypothetical protein
MEYVSALFESENEEKLRRQDFCLTCWDKKKLEERPLSSWKAKIPLEPPPTLSNQQDHLDHVLDLFQEALETGTEEAECEAYTLALYLTRKRKLTYRKEIKHQGKIGYLYENPETADVFFVKKVPLQSLEQHQIVDTLEKRISDQKDL